MPRLRVFQTGASHWQVILCVVNMRDLFEDYIDGEEAWCNFLFD